MTTFDGSSPRLKRRRLDDGSAAVSDSTLTITTHKQLQVLLAFQQSVSQDVKKGVRAFKEFLTSINEDRDEDQSTKTLQILKAYCDSQFVKDADGERAACFVDLVQTWSFAESNNEESLLSLIPSVLALFLKVVSTRLDFREFGGALCKFLLQKEQLRLFNRGLTASKSREHLISPCLRLLTEIASFDGGATARLLWSRRDVTLKRLEIFLTVGKTQTTDETDVERKPSLRRIAQRYLLANLKFQSASAKEELIGQGKLIRAFLENIRGDSRDIVLDIIKALDKHLASDSSLSRNAKSRFLNRWNLERLVTLYGFDRQSENDAPEGQTVSQEIHNFFLDVCTNPEKGVLLPENGWYPSGNAPDIVSEGNETIALGLDSPIYLDKYSESVPVRNGNISTMIQHLRPDTDTLQMELLLKIFRVAPELVCDFFTKRTMFTSDPKPTPSWLGESAFLFETIQLPVPANCGWKGNAPATPPPVSVVIENVLPRPLTQKVLTRCMNLNNDVVTLFAVKVSTLALHKLQAVLKVFQAERGSGQELWVQAAAKLADEFCRRCPTMKDTISAFRQTSIDNLQQQEAILELLATFYQVLPDTAFEAKFDVSLTLANVINRLDESELSKPDRESLVNQLEHLSVISQQSPTMRWWQKPESLEYSAFTSTLKVLVVTGNQSSIAEISNVVRDVLVQSSCLADSASFHALVKSLRVSNLDSLKAQLTFLDNCLIRLAKKPVLYLDTTENLLGLRKAKLSALMTTISEQWPFVVKSGDKQNEAAIASWVATFIGYLKTVGEDEEALTSIRDTIFHATDNKKARSVLKNAFSLSAEASLIEVNNASADPPTKNDQSKNATQAQLPAMFGKLPGEDETHAALHRWEREDLEESLEQGYIGELLLCLCSEHEEIRRQAHSAITRFMVKLKASTHEERQTIYILAGEVLETATELGLATPLPYVAGELAARMLQVLIDPLHKLYGKVNEFLNKGPRWEIGKIPSYWIDKILLNEPEHDGGYHQEVSWLLDLLLHGLRSQQDMDIYRRSGVFERVLSLYNSPMISESLRKKILQQLYRACETRGATTLLTRAGAVSWIQGQVANLDANSAVLQALANELCSGCDRDWVNRWSGSALLESVDRMTTST